MIKGNGMEMVRAKQFMAKQAETYANRVKNKQINDSCVTGLLSSDADYAGDNFAAKLDLLRFGIERYQSGIKST